MTVHWGGRGPGHGSRITTAAGVAAAPFSPATLFTGQVGGFWNVAQANVFSDDGVTQITDGGAVYRVNDLSGNGNHVKQATLANRPIWHANGGHPYIQTDGVNDHLDATFAGVAQPFDRVSAVQQVTWVAGGFILGDSTGTGIVLEQLGTTPTIYDFSSGGGNFNHTAGLALGTDGVITERINGASSSMQIDLTTAVTATSGTGAPGGITIGANSSGANPSAIRWYGSFMRNTALSGAQLLQVQQYMAGLQGRTI